MAGKNIFVFLLAFCILFLQNIDIVVADCPYLECGNFTGQRRTDCRYIERQGYNEEEEQELFCALWEGDYNYEEYEHPEYEYNFDLELAYEKIDNSTFITSFKILIFILFNYIVFSLTKSSLRKWQNAGS